MFAKSKILAALATSLLAIAGFASAQYGMPDFSGVDFNAIVAAQSAQTQADINAIMGQALQQRGPEIQAAYQQCLQAGYYCGRSFEEYALEYVSTNGFSDGGAWARQQQANAAALGQAWRGVQAAEAASAAAISGLNGSFIANSQEMGNVIVGNATYYGPQGSAVLPYGWQPNAYYQHQGQSYYVDYSGQYYWVDPNNSGWMYPINQGR